tara:strand:+ start:300 stop:494 length:195 start_codon:yes stop_codon:yes gene_type:complete
MTSKFFLKDKSIQSLCNIIGTGDISKGECPTCAGPIGEFKDDLSSKEYQISGMCQTCQDKMFCE